MTGMVGNDADGNAADMFRSMGRGPRTSRLLAALLALGLALSIGAVACAGAVAAAPTGHPGKRPSSKRHPAPPPAEVTLGEGAGTPGLTVSMAPVGLSLEYPVAALALGAGSCAPPALIAALEQLGSPPLSLAGDSQDMTVPSGALGSAPSTWETATLYQLPSSFWSQLHCLLSSTHDPLTVGLNVKTGPPAWAAQIVAGAQSAATNGLSFSLGNEPDLYGLPNYAALDEPQPNEEAAQVGLYLQLAGALEPSLGGAGVIGPELAQPAHWQHELPQVVSQLHLGTVGVHAYPLTACQTPKAVTIGGLLSSYAADEPHRLEWVAGDAHAAQVPAILSEANSASCGGVAGVSDSPAAAVWAVRFVLSALKSGFSEVRFHFSGDPYDPFLVHGEEVVKRPLDDALVALNQWLPVGSSLRTLAGVRGLVATGVTEPTGQTLVILDDESARAQAVVLKGAASAHVEVVSPARAGVRAALLSAVHGRIKLAVAANSVAVVSANL
jgi:hypothetical protein